jgi:hypothetical protein
LSCAAASFGSFARMDLTPLHPDAGEDLAHGLPEAGVPIDHDQQGRWEPPGREVVQEGHPGIRALPGAQPQVEEHHRAVLAEGVGGEDPLLLLALGPGGVELAIEEQVHDAHLTQVPGAPRVELGLERLGRATRGAPRHAGAEHLREEPLDVAGRETADVAAADQRRKLGRHAAQLVGQLDRHGRHRVSDLRLAEVEDAGLRLQRVVAVAVPVAGDGTFRPLVVAPAKDARHDVLEPDLQEQLSGPADELAERVAREPSLQILTKRFLHLGARWYSLHGVGAPFSVHRGRSGFATGRIPYAFSFLHPV